MIDQIINDYTNISEISDHYQDDILLEMVNYLLKESDIIYYMESTEESDPENKSEKPKNKILGWIKKAGATCVKVIKKIGKAISDKGKEIFNNHFKKVEKEKDSVQENEAIKWVNSDEFAKMLGEKGIKNVDVKIIRTSVIGYLKTGEVVTNVTSAFVANIEKLTNVITNDSKISFGGDLSGFWKNMVQNLLNFKPASISFDEYKQNTLNMLSKFKILNPLLKKEEDNTKKEMESMDADQENPDKKNTIFQNMKNRLSNLKSLSGWVDACKTKSENVIKAIEGTIEHFSKNKDKNAPPTKTDIENAQKQTDEAFDNLNDVTKKKVEEIQNANEIDKNEPTNVPQPEQKPEPQNQPADVKQQVQPTSQPTQPEQPADTQIQQEPVQQKTQEPNIQQQPQAEPVQPPQPEQPTPEQQQTTPANDIFDNPDYDDPALSDEKTEKADTLNNDEFTRSLERAQSQQQQPKVAKPNVNNEYIPRNPNPKQDVTDDINISDQSEYNSDNYKQPNQPQQSSQSQINTNMNAPNTRDVNQPIDNAPGKNIEIDNVNHSYKDPYGYGYTDIYIKGSEDYDISTNIDSAEKYATDYFTIASPSLGEDKPQLVRNDSTRSPILGARFVRTYLDNHEFISILPNPEFSLFQKMPLDRAQVNRTSKSLNDIFKGIFEIRGETSQPLFGVRKAYFDVTDNTWHGGILVFGGEEG